MTDEQLCSVLWTQKNNRDFLNAIQFQLTQKLQDTDQPVLVPGQRLPDIDNFPVLNATLAKNILAVSIRTVVQVLTDLENQQKLGN